MRRLVYGFCFAFLSFSQAFASPGFGIAPFKAQLVPQGLRNSQIFELTNKSDQPQAVQVSLYSWKMDEAGKETNQANPPGLTLYPDQFVLQPRSKQPVRVTWEGEPPALEQAFRVVAEQLPVRFGPVKVTRSIRFLLVYRAAFYVAPQEAQADIVVEKAERLKKGKGDTLVITLFNRGSAHTLLDKPALLLGEGSSPLRLEGKKLGGLAGQNIHAGARRRFELPWPTGLKGEPKEVKIEFTPCL